MWGVITGFLGRIFGLNLAADVLRWVAFRGLMLTLFVTILPIVFHNLFIWSLQFGGSILQRYMQSMGMSDQLEHVILEVTGLGAYLAQCFQVPQCFAILMTALAARFALNMLAALPVGRII